jgi:hypothetical protein
MNLIQAVKSGRPWKEKGRTHVWTKLVKDQYLGLSMEDSFGNHTQVLPHHLTETEWEIQEPEVRVTMTQFWEAVRKIQVIQDIQVPPGQTTYFRHWNLDNETAEELARLLGLEEPVTKTPSVDEELARQLGI